MTMQDLFKQLGGTIQYTCPPIPIREQDYQAFHPAFTDVETGGEYSIGHGPTAYDAARDGLCVILEHLEEVLG